MVESDWKITKIILPIITMSLKQYSDNPFLKIDADEICWTIEAFGEAQLTR